MSREEALKAMMDGHKVTHSYFTSEEYLHLVNGAVMSEDGYNFNGWLFLTTPGNEWKHDGWSIWKEQE